MRREIGGYFELELHIGRERYTDLIALNSARNALVYLIKVKKIKSINLPYFNCYIVADAVKRFCPETSIRYYHIDQYFKPDLNSIDPSEALYYVNYYGLQQNVLRELEYYHVILDNAQAFYSPPIHNGDTIYCPRKFFGVCDGAYLQTNTKLDVPLEYDTTWERTAYLLKRIDCGASAAYQDFQAAEAALTGKPLMKMSRLTQRILSGIDYEEIKNSRRKNFIRLHQFLGKKNGMFSLIESVFESDTFVPLCYPLMCAHAESLRKKLIQDKIYVPIYWPELMDSPELNDFEHCFVRQTVCLPIDQRCGEPEMEIIEQHLNEV
jgi:hypothetical protein